MTNLYIIHSYRNGDSFGGNEPLTNRDGTTVTEEQAITMANASWNHLTEAEQRRTESFFLCSAPFDEDGCCDLNRARIVKEFK